VALRPGLGKTANRDGSCFVLNAFLGKPLVMLLQSGPTVLWHLVGVGRELMSIYLRPSFATAAYLSRAFTVFISGQVCRINS
jgi:hypothetical protein